MSDKKIRWIFYLVRQSEMQNSQNAHLSLNKSRSKRLLWCLMCNPWCAKHKHSFTLLVFYLRLRASRRLKILTTRVLADAKSARLPMCNDGTAVEDRKLFVLMNVYIPVFAVHARHLDKEIASVRKSFLKDP